MVVEKLPEVVPPSGRVPRRGLLVLSIFEARRRRNRGKTSKKGNVPEGFSTRGINRRRGAARGGPGAPGGRLGHPWPPSGPTRALLEGSHTLIFPIFFPEFFWHFK